MIFALGYLTGLLTAILAFILIAYHRPKIEKALETVERKVEEVAKERPKGGVYFPPDPVLRWQRQRIKENQAKGLETPLSEIT